MGRLVAGIILLLVLLMGSAILWGRAHPGPDELEIAGFDVCDGKPCYMEITPGLTSWEHVTAIFKGLGADLADVTGSVRIKDLEIWVARDDAEGDGSASGITILDYSSQSHKLPVFAYFLQKYGQPCAIGDGNTPAALDAIYPSMELQIELNYGELSAASQVKQVQLSAPSVSRCSLQLKDLGFGYIVRPWLGFASLDHYRKQWLAN